MEEIKNTGKHSLAFAGRQNGTVTGVLDVISFDMNSVLLETTQGMLTVKGADLHVSRLNLDKGEVDIDGQVDSLAYSISFIRKGRLSLEDCFSRCRHGF